MEVKSQFTDGLRLHGMSQVSDQDMTQVSDQEEHRHGFRLKHPLGRQAQTQYE